MQIKGFGRHPCVRPPADRRVPSTSCVLKFRPSRRATATTGRRSRSAAGAIFRGACLATLCLLPRVSILYNSVGVQGASRPLDARSHRSPRNTKTAFRRLNVQPLLRIVTGSWPLSLPAEWSRGEACRRSSPKLPFTTPSLSFRRPIIPTARGATFIRTLSC
jgi:hypothetical protein